MGMPSGRTNSIPWKWAWPRSRDPYIFWHTIEHISKTTWVSEFKFGMQLCMGIPSMRTSNFPWKLAWPRSREWPLQFWAYDWTSLQNYLS